MDSPRFAQYPPKTYTSMVAMAMAPTGVIEMVYRHGDNENGGGDQGDMVLRASIVVVPWPGQWGR